MNRPEFYKLFASECGISQAEAKKCCIALFALLKRCIREEDRVYIKDFGTFKKKIYKEHRVGDFKGGEIIRPSYEKIVFVPYSGSSTDE